MNDRDFYNTDSIIDYFDLNEMRRIIKEQITDEDDFSVCNTVVDHLQPLYNKYKTIDVNIDNGITIEDVEECHRRYNAISYMFIDAISKKFGIHLSEFWLDEASDDDIALVTLYLYTYFVVDLKMVLVEVLTNYIDANIDELVNEFESSAKNQKDAVYMAYKDTMDPKHAVVCGNIFDVLYHILDTITVEEFFQYSPMDYIPLSYLTEMFEECKIEGDFTDSIFALVKGNSSLKSIIAFEIISHAKNMFKLNKEESDNEDSVE